MSQDIDLIEAAEGSLAGPRTASRGGSLAESAYVRLRDDIITVKLQPGDPLDEKQLSRDLGVGLTPVRDALKRLRHERLAVIYPRRGTFVAEINISDERWLTEVRTDLEGLAAALAAERATDEECAELKRMAEAMEDAVEVSRDYITQDTEIHRAIYRAAHNPYLEATLTQYSNLAMRIWHYGLVRARPSTPRSCAQDEVVEEICARRPGAARKAAQAHLLGFSASVRSML
ncbi:GntR family transcriptional regulator [Streptomyces cavernicola]|uniref:GntR family transcriptional regulator n=1 Tax=Streptomyces cavernicola TaxID=3043613 RepID=A0ABT6SE21_9ACTN|nr:GntR family transcriptional regulator [Streptomyces sp. B-S-A6]MDI3406445.1 GntR family transcriptional regulator [Streptomyces sp. B-S-A6]